MLFKTGLKGNGEEERRVSLPDSFIVLTLVNILVAYVHLREIFILSVL